MSESRDWTGEREVYRLARAAMEAIGTTAYVPDHFDAAARAAVGDYRRFYAESCAEERRAAEAGGDEG